MSASATADHAWDRRPNPLSLEALDAHGGSCCLSLTLLQLHHFFGFGLCLSHHCLENFFLEELFRALFRLGNHPALCLRLPGKPFGFGFGFADLALLGLELRRLAFEFGLEQVGRG